MLSGQENGVDLGGVGGGLIMLKTYKVIKELMVFQKPTVEKITE